MAARSVPASLVPEKARLHIGMIVYQLGFGGNHVIMKLALMGGVSKLVFPFYRNIIALLAVAPFAYLIEKKDRPKLSLYLLTQFFFLGLIGTTLNQGFYIYGLHYTSPTLTSAIENCVPAVTFIIAALLGIEQVHLTRKDGIAKVVGTIISVSGAFVTTLYRGPTVYSLNKTPPHQSLLLPEGDAEGKYWTLGCICLIGHTLSWACYIVLQAPFLKIYPARLSSVSYAYLFAIMQFGATALYFDRNPESWQISSDAELLTILYAGLVASGMISAIQIWVVDRGGPLFVSMYLPVQTLVAAVMGTFILGEKFYLGGIIGGVLLIAGLYLVVLGKNEESKYVLSSKQKEQAERSSLIEPLLHDSLCGRNEA